MTGPIPDRLTAREFFRAMARTLATPVGKPLPVVLPGSRAVTEPLHLRRRNRASYGEMINGANEERPTS